MNLSGMVYHCSAGETFDTVALDAYGDEKYAAELLNANPTLCTVPVFGGGETLLLPLVEKSEDSGTDETMPDKAPWR